MSLINPIPQQTVIKFYKDVVWDNSYKDIRWFSSVSQRNSYFNARLTDTFENCSIAKPGRAIRVQGSTEHFLKCNYLSWRNVGLTENREYYAFITAVNYVNVNTVEIEYEVDWVQSYLFDFVFEAFMVEREHVADDTFGKHTLPENLDTGEYVIKNVTNNTYSKGLMAYYLSTVVENIELKKRDGMYYGTELFYATEDSPTTIAQMSQLLSQLNRNGEANEVVKLCMIAGEMVQTNGMHESFDVAQDNLQFTYWDESYTAKNNKMRGFPFKFFTLDNYEGMVQDFRYEEFPANGCSFKVEGTMTPTPCMMCFPINYKGAWGDAVQQFAITFTNFPEIAWTSDTFRAWVSQNSVGIAQEGLKHGLQIASGALNVLSGQAGEGISQIVEGGFGIAGMQQQIENKQIHSQSLQGNIAMAGMSYFRNTIGFRVTEYCCRPEIAKRADQFMTRYGYRVDAVKIPEVNSRQYCNYVKGSGAVVGGDIAEDAKLTMERALNSGVTFWHTDNIGMTLTENPIIGG